MGIIVSVVDENSVVEMYVNQVSIYYNHTTDKADCYEDENLKIYQTKPGKKKLLKTLCGSSRNQPPIKSVTNMATIIFTRFAIKKLLKISKFFLVGRIKDLNRQVTEQYGTDFQ